MSALMHGIFLLVRNNSHYCIYSLLGQELHFMAGNVYYAVTHSDVNCW